MIHETVEVTQTLKIYSRDVNSSFLLSTPTKAILGKTQIGDRRGAKVLEDSVRSPPRSRLVDPHIIVSARER